MSMVALLKGEAACCMALVDDLGRPPIGYCGPDCERKRRASLIRDCIAQVRAIAPPRRLPVSIDKYPGWEPWASVWDDPTGDSATERGDDVA